MTNQQHRLCYEREILKLKLGHLLSSLLEQNKITVSKLAKQTGFKKYFIRRILAGNVDPTLDQVVTLLFAFDVRLSLYTNSAT